MLTDADINRLLTEAINACIDSGKLSWDTAGVALSEAVRNIAELARAEERAAIIALLNEYRSSDATIGDMANAIELGGHHFRRLS